MRLDKQRTYGLMAERGIKLRELWHEASHFKPDLTEATTWRAANGNRDVSLEVAQAIAQALGCTVDYLVGGSDVVQANGLLRVAPELIALVQHLNSLTPEQRGKVAKALYDLLVITYRVQPANGAVGGLTQAIRNADADVETLAAILEEMPPEARRKIQALIDQRAADLEDTTGDCELAPPKPARLFPDE